MDLSTFIVSVFCVIDDWLKDKKVRQRGPKPTLWDSEVLTMEVVGEFLGMDEDKAIYTYFGSILDFVYLDEASINNQTHRKELRK